MPIDLGSITFGIGADTTRLRSSINDIVNFGTAVTAAASAASTAGTAVESAFRRQEAAVISALQKVQAFQDKVASLKAPANLTQGFNQLSTRALDQFVQRMTSGQMSAIQFQREMERFNVTMGNSQRILGQWASAQKAAAEGSMVANLQKLSGAAVLIAGPLSGIATRISVVASLADHFSLAWAGMIAGVAAGAYAFYKLSTSIITTEKSLQSVTQTLAAVYGNTTIANLQMKYLSDLSDKTGVSFVSLAKQYGQIEAAAKGTTLEGERVQKVFEAIVFSGAKLGLSGEEVEGTLKAIQQMMSKGSIQAEELRGQLGDRLPGAIKIMADAMGVTTQKLGKMMQQGELGASVLTKFADQLVKRYNIDTSANIDTIAAAEGRLGNARIRMIDTMDKILGISDAYKNSLKYITDGLNGATNNSQRFVQVVAAVAGGLLGAFAGSAIVTGLGAIVGGVTSLTAAVAGLNAAAAAGAARSLIMVIARLGLAIAGGMVAWKLSGEAIEGAKQSYLSAVPAVDEYIKAQEKLVTSVRGPTAQYLKQQQEMLDNLTNQQGPLQEQAKNLLGTREALEKVGNTAEFVDTVMKSMGEWKVFGDLNKVNSSIEVAKRRIESLQKIFAEQTKAENTNRTDPAKELTNRQQVAMEKAAETIKDTKAQYDRLFLAPAAKAYAETQDDINHKIESFKEGLERAEVPADKLKTLLAQYTDSITKLKQGELSLKSYTSSFQAMEGIFSRGVDQGLGNFIDVLVDGKDKMIALGDTVKFVAKDILKTFLTLAALNPLKNFLFGTNNAVLGGGAGTGGALGGLGSSAFSSIKSLFGGGSPEAHSFAGGMSPMAFGGVMTSSGSKPLRRYSAGGIARGSQFAEFGEGSKPEAYVPLPDGRSIPVSMSGSMGGGVEMHIHEAPGHKSQVTQSQGSGGKPRIDVAFKQMFRDAFISDVAEGGPASQSLERQYGVNRAKGIA